MITFSPEFPEQKVSWREKQKESWYANCIDFVISRGLAFNDRSETETKLNVLHGDIPNEFYKKTLNPYNSNNEKYLNFPATMRNLDIMNDVVRRYVSEYHKGIHEFTVSASNAEIVLKRNAKLREEISKLAQEAFKQEFEQRYAQLQQQAVQSGQDPKTINPQEAMPDPEEFMRNFNEKYIDDESKQAQDVLDYIRAVTDDLEIYLTSFFNYCALGECYTYAEVRGDKIVKECVPALEAYPIPNSKFFVEDHDMFARRMLLTYPQIKDMFKDELTSKDNEFLEKYYNRSNTTGKTTLLYKDYFEYSATGCEKFTDTEREMFKKEPVNIIDYDGCFEVWHVVWRGEAKKGILTYINEIGLVTQRVVDETYQMNKEAGDIAIDWKYEQQIYEGYRIGSRYNAIYPIKARPVSYQRNNKLPYNGIMEILPLMGKFSIITAITPYQILRNIISYHREMVIAKNKMFVLLIPQSLIMDEAEDKIYRMSADSVLYVNDEEDTSGQKMANIRMLNANMGTYISELTNLMEAIKQEAREMVDMNMQRYGEIAQSAGADVTREAVARSSMGSVIIMTMFDEMRKRDYQRDIEFAKLAYIDGLQDSFIDDQYNRRFISLDVNSFVYSDYSVLVKNDQKELDKIKQLKDWAFSAAQNGDLDMAIAAITGDNVTQIKDTVAKFMDIKRKHEEEMKQMDQMLKEEELQNKLAEIEAKGEQDRLTEQLKYQYEIQLKYMDIDVSQLAPIDNSKSIIEEHKNNLENEKLNIQREKLAGDMYNAAAERQVKREQIASQEKIAKMNKNKYDK